jgi:branched-chain amino acid transport system permease protein
MFLQLNYFDSEIAVYVIIAVILSMLLIFTANLINSPTGRAMQAMRSSTSAAQAMGISLMKYRLLAFVIATLFATVSGYLYMMITKNIVPTSETKFNLATSLNILGAVIIGGSMSIWGVLGGIFFVFGLQPLVLSNIPFFQQNEEFIVLLTGLLMIIVVMFFPGGFAHIVLQIRLSIMKALQKWRVRKYGTEA